MPLLEPSVCPAGLKTSLRASRISSPQQSHPSACFGILFSSPSVGAAADFFETVYKFTDT